VPLHADIKLEPFLL